MKKVIPDSDITIGESMATTYGAVKDARCLACGVSYSLSKILLQDPCAPSAVIIGLCAKHQYDVDNGYVHLIGVDQGSPKMPNGRIDPHQVMRTGSGAQLTVNTYLRIFEQEVPELGVVFVNEAVLLKLKDLHNNIVKLTDGETDEETHI